MFNPDVVNVLWVLQHDAQFFLFCFLVDVGHTEFYQSEMKALISISNML